MTGPPPTAPAKDPKIAVFVCKCGTTNAKVIDVPAVLEMAKGMPGVIHTAPIEFACGDGGAKEIRDQIASSGSTRAVVASCTCCSQDQLCSTCSQHRVRLKDKILFGSKIPRQHFELVSIRELAVYAHPDDHVGASEKAEAIVRMGIAKAALLEDQPTEHFSQWGPEDRMAENILPHVAIVGTGVGAFSAAITLHDMGYEVYLISAARVLGLPPSGGWTCPEAELEYLKTASAEIVKRPRITFYPGARVKAIDGRVGEWVLLVEEISAFAAKAGQRPAELELRCGLIILDQLADEWHPEGIFGFRKIRKEFFTPYTRFRPQETAIRGIFVCGQEGLSVPELVEQGQGAVAKAEPYLSSGIARIEATRCIVHPDICMGCSRCLEACPFGALRMADGKAIEIPTLCHSCGMCAVACPVRAIEMVHFTDEQIMAQVAALLEAD